MSTTLYFKVWGVGIKVEDQETVWLQPDEIESEFATYNVGRRSSCVYKTRLLMHTYFPRYTESVM